MTGHERTLLNRKINAEIRKHTGPPAAMQASKISRVPRMSSFVAGSGIGMTLVIVLLVMI